MDLHRLARRFSPALWDRGRAVVRAGRVLELDWDHATNAGSARVRGSNGELYEVTAFFREDLDELEVGGTCDCPAARPCKHIVALVCASQAFDDDDDIPFAQSQVDRGDTFERWAARARGSIDAPARGPERAPKKRLVFVVRVERAPQTHDGRARVVVVANTIALRKDGTPGKAQQYDLSSTLLRIAEKRPAWLDDADLTLWFRLQSLLAREPDGWFYGGRLRFPHVPAAAALFAEFVATGRCRLDVADGPILVGRDARPGRVGWELEPDGSQHLRVRPNDGGPPWIVLPLQPLHWVDPTNGECGPIALDVPQAVAPFLADVPPIEPDWSGGIPSDMRAALAACGLPPPRALERAPTRRIQPVPVLQLHAQRKADGDSTPTAELAFDYDGLLVGASVPSTRFFRVEGELVRRIDRDRAAEQNARRRLAALGLEGRGSALGMRSLDAWFELGRSGVPALRGEGWRIAVDDDFEWLAVPIDRFVATTVESESDDGSWFLELGIEVDGVRVDLLPIILGAIRSGRLVRERLRIDGRPVMLPLPDGRRVAIEAARLAAMLDVLVELYDERPAGPLQLAKHDALRLDGLDGWTVELSPRLRALADRLQAGPIARVPVPDDLAATLREYQCRGLDWLQWLREGELGGILADDMGLGKTVQALAHLLVEKHAGRLDRPALVVAPRSVLRNWQREAERFTPSLRCAVYHGPSRAKVLAAIDRWDVVVTTYALLQRDDALAAVSWRVAILDEAQMIKNPAAKVATAARSLAADRRICMTGTPMENNLGDLWSLMTFANPGLLGTAKQFNAWYRSPIERGGEVERFDALCRRIAPFLLRRTKAQVLAELPPKTEILLHAALEGPQRDLYESVRLTMEKRVRDELAARGLARSRIVVLDALLKLRQVCCDPRLLKIERAAKIEGSAKLELLVELVQELVAEGRRALVFSQFTSMLAVIERELQRLEIPWLSITGKTDDRQAIVDRFQAGEVPVLLVSLKAGGTGLNLTAADTVIHYDPWWNPAVEAQA
ncbi:MAG TPA: SNF2-related protein, partial [Nannocystaceae bacterium]|nr:SNF2-related protein [Nannocystaceae bacterium]